GYMILSHAAQFLRHDQAEEAVLGEGLEVLPRIDEFLVALDGVLTHRRLAEIDQRLLQLLLLVGQQPLRIELEPKAPEWFLAPHFDVGHATALAWFGLTSWCAWLPRVLSRQLNEFQPNLSKWIGAAPNAFREGAPEPGLGRPTD